MLLMKVAYNALKNHKYKYPKDELKLLQICMDGFINYRRSQNEDESDVSFA